MKRIGSFVILFSLLLGACDRRQTASPSPAEVAAVNASLGAFFIENWTLDDRVVFVAPSAFSTTLPKKIAGMPVEVISDEDLSARFAGRERAPQLVNINVYEASKPDVDFCVGVSISSVIGMGAKFSAFHLGGGRQYEYAVVSGKPVLIRTHTVEH